MPILSQKAANRLGFLVLGLSNNFVFVTMLSAAFDLLNQSNKQITHQDEQFQNSTHMSNITLQNQQLKQPYCNTHSTAAILVATTLPSLIARIVNPFLLLSVPASYKVIVSALLTATSFIVTGHSKCQLFIFIGVICGSFSFGLGESTFLSIMPLYGDVSVSGWSIGMGQASFFGSLVYALLRMYFSIRIIMIILLVFPVLLLIAYFKFITPIKDNNLPVISPPGLGVKSRNGKLGFRAKLLYMPTLTKYILPLVLVYFAEFFINQGLIELIYYPDVGYLDHAAQYRWFQVAYRFGAMLAASSIELIQIRNIWAMSVLQFTNLILFLAHTTKLIHLPSFYLVMAIIVYEGLLGGFTYVNALYRIKKEVPVEKQELSMGIVTTGDMLGVVLAGLVALQAHPALCRLYD